MCGIAGVKRTSVGRNISALIIMIYSSLRGTLLLPPNLGLGVALELIACC
jgi:hypothetical protein